MQQATHPYVWAVEIISTEDESVFDSVHVATRELSASEGVRGAKEYALGAYSGIRTALGDVERVCKVDTES